MSLQWQGASAGEGSHRRGSTTRNMCQPPGTVSTTAPTVYTLFASRSEPAHSNVSRKKGFLHDYVASSRWDHSLAEEAELSVSATQGLLLLLLLFWRGTTTVLAPDSIPGKACWPLPSRVHCRQRCRASAMGIRMSPYRGHPLGAVVGPTILLAPYRSLPRRPPPSPLANPRQLHSLPPLARGAGVDILPPPLTPRPGLWILPCPVPRHPVDRVVPARECPPGRRCPGGSSRGPARRRPSVEGFAGLVPCQCASR